MSDGYDPQKSVISAIRKPEWSDLFLRLTDALVHYYVIGIRNTQMFLNAA